MASLTLTSFAELLSIMRPVSFSSSVYQDFNDIETHSSDSSTTRQCINMRVRLRVDFMLRLRNGDNDRLVNSNTFLGFRLYRREEVQSDPSILNTIVTELSLPTGFTAIVTSKMTSLLTAMENDPRNSNRKVWTMVVQVSLVSPFDNHDRRDRNQDQTAGTGLSIQEVSWRLERFKVEDNSELGEEKNCPICWNDLSDGGDKIPARLPCGHVYDNECITMWLKTNNSCPLCRNEVPVWII